MSNEAKSYFYSVLGIPEALQRARYSGGRFYDSQKNFKMIFAIGVEHQHGDNEWIIGPVSIDMTFVMPIPAYLKKREAELIDSYHYVKPDGDNLTKMLWDCLNGILYKDDCQIASFAGRKIYGLIPRTDMVVAELRGKYVKT